MRREITTGRSHKIRSKYFPTRISNSIREHITDHKMIHNFLMHINALEIGAGKDTISGALGPTFTTLETIVTLLRYLVSQTKLVCSIILAYRCGRGRDYENKHSGRFVCGCRRGHGNGGGHRGRIHGGGGGKPDMASYNYNYA